VAGVGATTTSTGEAEGGNTSELTGDAALPLHEPPYEWVGIVGTGQSLAVGAGARIVNDVQPYANVKLEDVGPDPKCSLSGTPDWRAVPLTEPIRTRVAGTGPGYDDQQYPNNIRGETPQSSMANTLSAIWQARTGGSYVTAHSAVGMGGSCLEGLSKGTGYNAYPASLREATAFRAIAQQQGKTFGYAGIVLTHGECDATNEDYGPALYRFWSEYNADLKVITGQREDVVLFASQQSTMATGLHNSAVQLWQAGNDHPGRIVCIGPKYQYEYAEDGVHLTAGSYARLGAKHGEVFDLVVNQKRAWQPLGPVAAMRNGAVIWVDFHVPNPPLRWDPNLQSAHQVANGAWAKGRGFEVRGDGDQPLGIADVSIAGSSVLITLDELPAPDTKLEVSYALTAEETRFGGGSVLGMRGQLRDSDAFVGDDWESLLVTVEHGSRVVNATTRLGLKRRSGYDLVSGPGLPDGVVVLSQESDERVTLSEPWPGQTGTVELTFRHDHSNYCVHFSMPVD
jgi:hypothetical protein